MRFTSLSLLSPFIGTSLLSNLIQPIHASPVAPLHPTLRQRDLSLDVCASLSLHLLFINLDACVCLSTATSFCQNNGLDKSLITNLITTSSKKCSYPNHGRPTCSGKQCSFECIPPFIKSGQTCACPQGKTEYQGTCISSGSALPKVRRSNPVCMKGFTVCGAYGNGGPAWECVDTRSDLESCGGCMLPFMESTSKGVDCTTIPNINAVACVKGSCQIRRCARHYALSQDGTSCVDSRHTTNSTILIPAPLSEVILSS